MKSPQDQDNHEFDKSKSSHLHSPDFQQIDLKLSSMMQFMNDFALSFQTRDPANQVSSLDNPSLFGRPESQGQRQTGLLTTQVWPKSRMLFAVVSKMAKEGLLSPA